MEIVALYKQPIAMSGLAITSLGGASMLTARPDDVMKQVLPAPPVAARAFAQNDELAVFTEVYDNSGNAPHKVDFVTSVLTDEGRVLYKNEEVRDSSELQGAKGGFGYTSRVPLSATSFQAASKAMVALAQPYCPAASKIVSVWLPSSLVVTCDVWCPPAS